MKESLKYFLERTTFLGSLARHRRYKRMIKRYIEWQKKGSVLPMPFFGKQKVLAEYVDKFRPPILIETGTFQGHMVYAMMNKFEQIFSIEIDQTLYKQAEKKFMGYHHIHILQGDSSDILPKILEDITYPCLFWLDAHWSGGKTAKGELETPIMQELQCILNHPHANYHILLIDDARHFSGTNDYPTLNRLKSFILESRPNWIFEVKDDIIRTHVKKKT